MRWLRLAVQTISHLGWAWTLGQLHVQRVGPWLTIRRARDAVAMTDLAAECSQCLVLILLLFMCMQSNINSRHDRQASLVSVANGWMTLGSVSLPLERKTTTSLTADTHVLTPRSAHLCGAIAMPIKIMRLIQGTWASAASATRGSLATCPAKQEPCGDQAAVTGLRTKHARSYAAVSVSQHAVSYSEHACSAVPAASPHCDRDAANQGGARERLTPPRTPH